MNNDLISRKALIEAYDKAHKGPPGGARKLMEEAPAVDAVEVVHGEWEFGELGPVGATVKCSNCGWGVNAADPILWLEYSGHKFCGNCGAKMDGGEEE